MTPVFARPSSSHPRVTCRFRHRPIGGDGADLATPRSRVTFLGFLDENLANDGFETRDRYRALESYRVHAGGNRLVAFAHDRAVLATVALVCPSPGRIGVLGRLPLTNCAPFPNLSSARFPWRRLTPSLVGASLRQRLCRELRWALGAERHLDGVVLRMSRRAACGQRVPLLSEFHGPFC